MLQFLLLAMMLAYVSAATPYTACHTPDPFVSLDVDGCTDQVCEVHRGETKHIKVTLIAPFDNHILSTTIVARVGIFSYTTRQSQCPNLVPPQSDGNCNIVSAQTYTIEYDYTVPTFAPNGMGDFTVTRKGDDDQVISCAVVKIEVIS